MHAVSVPEQHSPSALERWVGYLALLLLLGAVGWGCYVRQWELDSVPPGGKVDEIIKGRTAATFLDHTLGELLQNYEPSFSRRESMYMYATALSMFLFGINMYALRVTSSFFGYLTVLLLLPTVWLFFRGRMSGRMALLLAVGATALLAMQPWHVCTSRVATRCISVNTFQLLVYLFWFLAERYGKPWYLVSAMFLGMSLFTYPPVRTTAFLLIAAVAWRIWKEGWPFLRGHLLWAVLYGLTTGGTWYFMLGPRRKAWVNTFFDPQTLGYQDSQYIKTAEQLIFNLKHSFQQWWYNEIFDVDYSFERHGLFATTEASLAALGVLLALAFAWKHREEFLLLAALVQGMLPGWVSTVYARRIVGIRWVVPVLAVFAVWRLLNLLPWIRRREGLLLPFLLSALVLTNTVQADRLIRGKLLPNWDENSEEYNYFVEVHESMKRGNQVILTDKLQRGDLHTFISYETTRGLDNPPYTDIARGIPLIPPTEGNITLHLFWTDPPEYLGLALAYYPLAELRVFPYQMAPNVTSFYEMLLTQRDLQAGLQREIDRNQVLLPTSEEIRKSWSVPGLLRAPFLCEWRLSEPWLPLAEEAEHGRQVRPHPPSYPHAVQSPRLGIDLQAAFPQATPGTQVVARVIARNSTDSPKQANALFGQCGLGTLWVGDRSVLSDRAAWQREPLDNRDELRTEVTFPPGDTEVLVVSEYHTEGGWCFYLRFIDQQSVDGRIAGLEFVTE